MTENDSTAGNDIMRHGLTAEQVRQSRQKHGANVLTPPARDPWWKLYFEKFGDPIIRILMLAAAIALVVGLYDGHYIEGIGIIFAILLSTGLAFINEYQAGKEFDILNRVSDDEPVAVMRDGEHQLAPKRDLVVGDVAFVEQGAEIPADCRVLESVSFTVVESSLTGESTPVAKFTEGTRLDPVGFGLAYPRHETLRGTTVLDGHATLLVEKVGDATEIGKTARAAAESPDSLTPLGKQLEKLAGLISIGAFAAAAVIFAAQTVRGAYRGEIHDLVERQGRIIPVPLEPGQWYCFFLLAVVMLIVGAKIWFPVFRNAANHFGWDVDLPAWFRQPGGAGFLRLVGLAAAVGVAGVLVGLLLGVLGAVSGPWLPLSALGAFLRYFMVAVTVIVVAVPEGLPMCVTLALAYSMRKMTATNNLVRKMHACETIGAATVILSDKTGTLTMNEMRVHKPVFPFLPYGDIPRGNRLADVMAEAIAGNSTAHLEKKGDRTAAIGNPTEGALLLWIDSSNRDYETIRQSFGVVRQLTFTTERKFMATAGVSALTGVPTVYVKGAPEIVMARCAALKDRDGADAPLDGADREKILAEITGYQNRGMRIIGFAVKEIAPEELQNEIDPDLDGLVWQGFVAIADPIRAEVPPAIASAIGAGIKVKVVTGDNQATAREIARQAGLWSADDTDDNIVTGDLFMAQDDAEAAATAERVKVMSRARPMHKLRLVKLLQGGNEVVAVTGDGTNDAPALNHADVGLAMGRTGTAVAKEAADIILLDDSFNSIVNAVSWGRSLYANIQKFVVFQLTINVAAVGIALLGPFLGVTLPLTVVQMLWVNLIMDTFAALALASEPPDWELMRNPPRPADAFIITPGMKKAILGVGCSFLVLFLIVILGFSATFPLDAGTEAGRHNLTIFFTAFVMLQFWNLFNARAFGVSHSALANLGQSRGFLAMAIVILVGQILLVEFGGDMFRVGPLSAKEWIAILVFTSPVLWIGELWRYVKRHRNDPDYWVYS